ncbi:ankyrin repeat domain-containing protein 30A [Bubalus kerabau]|uniref:ankyrin repeat domain-containing protein 30A n=1 Tax=Bubalus carabanensis TaxID=3119969 RepID=UPI00244E6C62|nr:ankyrin repeat domain-containing protein 30A [Bubalus carabanensis]
MITEEEQGKLDEDENNHAQVEEEKKHKSSEVEVSENICDAADENGLFQQRKSGGKSNQEFPAMQNEGSDRFTLNQEEKNRRNAEMLYEKMREHLRKEDQYSKEVEVKQHLEVTFQAVEVIVKTERNNLNQVYDSCEETEDLLHKKLMLQEEIAMLRLEIDALKNQHQEKEENYFEDIEILKVKNDDL